MLDKLTRLSKQALDMIITKIALSFDTESKEEYKDLWLISERGTEAKDNGFCFFEYIVKNHPQINVRYVIDLEKAGNDAVKLKPYMDKIIKFKSKEHKKAFLMAKYAISSHSGFLEPWSYRLYKMILDRQDKKTFVFLQHGVILHDLSDYASREKIRADLFITTTKREYESISSPIYGYRDEEVVQTGIARFDKLNDFDLKKQILIMPTWRQDIVNPSYAQGAEKSDEIFTNSEYFTRFNSLINNVRLDKILGKNGYKLVFYPHYEIQPYIKYFEKKSKNLVIAKKEEYDVQDLLKSSEILVTDFSSIQFDFAYMRKPLCYYQFDSIDSHYKTGYFDYEVDGFGPVFSEEEEVVDYIAKLLKSSEVPKLEQKYLDRINAEFNYHDDKNCERIYKEIIRIEK